MQHARVLFAQMHPYKTHCFPGRRQVDAKWQSIAQHPATAPGKSARPDNMCYIIFTSGSTGRPKGVVLQHAGVINYLHCLVRCARHRLLLDRMLKDMCEHSTCQQSSPSVMQERAVGHRKLKQGPSNVFLQKAPISFDASVQELFNSLACGGVLLLAAPGGEKDTQYLARLCKEQRVTDCSFVPSQLDVLLQARWIVLHVSSIARLLGLQEPLLTHGGSLGRSPRHRHATRCAMFWLAVKRCRQQWPSGSGSVCRTRICIMPMGQQRRQ